MTGGDVGEQGKAAAAAVDKALASVLERESAQGRDGIGN